MIPLEVFTDVSLDADEDDESWRRKLVMMNDGYLVMKDPAMKIIKGRKLSI